MWRSAFGRAALVVALAAAPLQAAELRAALGAFVLGQNGMDLTFSYRGASSHWQYGIRYLTWVDTFSDPFTGNDLTETTNTMQGVFVDYLFDPESGAGWYVGVEALQWSKAEHSLLTLETGTDSVVAAYFGGGYLWTFGERWYWDLGMFIAPGAELSTSTSVSSEEDSGGFDIRVQFGVVF